MTGIHSLRQVADRTHKPVDRNDRVDRNANRKANSLGIPIGHPSQVYRTVDGDGAEFILLRCARMLLFAACPESTGTSIHHRYQGLGPVLVPLLVPAVSSPCLACGMRGCWPCSLASLTCLSAAVPFCSVMRSPAGQHVIEGMIKGNAET